jgi:hypothetical protein
VDVSTALLSHLTQLANSIGLDADVLSSPLRTLARELSAAVHSYRGLQLTIVRNGQPVTLTDLPHADEDGLFVTSLRVPLNVLSPSYEAGSRVIFYAGTAGSLIDLATDLGYVLKTPTTTANELERHGAAGNGERPPRPAHPRPPLLVLDADLPPNPAVSGLTGLSELSAVNRAVGIMIDWGHRPDRAYDTLRHRADAAGLETHVYAAHLVGR